MVKDKKLTDIMFPKVINRTLPQIPLSILFDEITYFPGCIRSLKVSMYEKVIINLLLSSLGEDPYNLDDMDKFENFIFIMSEAYKAMGHYEFEERHKPVMKYEEEKLLGIIGEAIKKKNLDKKEVPEKLDDIEDLEKRVLKVKKPGTPLRDLKPRKKRNGRKQRK